MKIRWSRGFRLILMLLLAAALVSVSASDAVRPLAAGTVRSLSGGRLQPLILPSDLTEAYRRLGQAMFVPDEPGRRVGGSKKPRLWGRGAGSHVILIQLESFQNFLMRVKVEGQEVTPNLNRLAGESLYFPNVFQQIGRGNTSDAEFVANTSLYPVGNEPMFEQYADRSIPSLARLLGAQGYRTWTFHVNKASFWNRSRMYPALGFDAYFDKPFYRPERFSRFGASDEELFRAGLKKLKQADRAGQKIFAQFVTVSSHSPFSIPEESVRLHMESKQAKTLLGRYAASVHYTDDALGKFIEGLRSSGLWEKSLVVVYGDHFGLNRKKYNPETIRKVLDSRYLAALDTYNVPLLIHWPGQREGEEIRQAGGQIDILPTLANLLGIRLETEPFLVFGHDLLNVRRNLIGIRYYLRTGSFVNNEVLFAAGPHGFRDGTAISLDTRKPVALRSEWRRQCEWIMEWEKLSDRYVNLLPRIPDSPKRDTGG
ncbi:LTA synthase family protein [Paenibacillus glufosinatiresistens]|uniref:LTA synthase family protein n=1 Tax=Paenibacillus glufosinatiresistens TaxID=3070657 RepID=UPI00286E5E8A|nr:LTA synthase family protein [Paenibacillus sp. YX.27]